MCEVKLGLVVENGFVKLTVSQDFSIEPPIVKGFDCFAEDLVLDGWPLKGLPNP